MFMHIIHLYTSKYTIIMMGVGDHTSKYINDGRSYKLARQFLLNGTRTASSTRAVANNVGATTPVLCE